MVLKPQARQLYLDGVVNSVGQTFLSTTMRCFKCHDHKFDPLPTRDYYRMYAAFSATQLAERPAPLPRKKIFRASTRKKPPGGCSTSRRKIPRTSRKAGERRQGMVRQRGKEYVNENKRRSLPDEEKPPRYVGLNPVEQGRLKVRRQDDWIWTVASSDTSPWLSRFTTVPCPIPSTLGK